MDDQSIRAFVEENRRIANQQLTRWDAVDPSRLLEACAIIETLLERGTAEPAAGDQALVFDDVILTGLKYTPPVRSHPPIEVQLTFLLVAQSTIPLAGMFLVLLGGSTYQSVRIEVRPT